MTERARWLVLALVASAGACGYREAPTSMEYAGATYTFTSSAQDGFFNRASYAAGSPTDGPRLELARVFDKKRPETDLHQAYSATSRRQHRATLHERDEGTRRCSVHDNGGGDLRRLVHVTGTYKHGTWLLVHNEATRESPVRACENAEEAWSRLVELGRKHH